MKFLKDNSGCLIYVVGIVVFIAVSLALRYWIAVSDLPDWFKFTLLR